MILSTLASMPGGVREDKCLVDFSTVVFCANSRDAKEDIASTIHRIQICSESIASQILSPSICQKLAALLVAKQLTEVDKIVTESLSAVVTHLLRTARCGSSSFRLTPLLDSSDDLLAGFAALRQRDGVSSVAEGIVAQVILLPI
jgi:hypothetical protein